MAAPFSLGETARDAYERLAKDREGVLSAAREMAEITIPSAFPPEGHRAGDPLRVPNQSINADAVKTLASKLMLMALPPHRPAVNLELVEHKLHDDMEADPELASKVQVALQRVAQEHKRRMETSQLRSAYVGASKQLLIAGNVLWQHINLDTPIYHRMDRYVVKRDSEGRQRFVVLKTTTEVAYLDPDVQDLVKRSRITSRTAEPPEQESTADIYTVCKLDSEASPKVWRYWQEFEGEVIPGTEATAPADSPQLYAAWLIPMYGEDWGRSYCDEYRGDLFAVENLSGALNDGAAMASLSWIFNPPGSGISTRELMQADNMKVLTGNGQNISAFQFGKGADFQMVSNTLETVARRIAKAFLLLSSVQRDAERVTAEEWSKMAAELDQAMGGLYSELAQSFQRHVVLRFVEVHRSEDKDLPKLPKEVVRVGVVTGIDAMGRSTEGESTVRLVSTFTQIMGPPAVAKINADDFFRRLAASEAINPDGLLKTDDQLAAEQQQAMAAQQQSDLLKAVAPPIAKVGAEAVGQQMAATFQQQQQPQQG